MKKYLSKEKTQILRSNNLIKKTEVVYELADLLVAECVETGEKRTLDCNLANGVINEAQHTKRILKG